MNSLEDHLRLQFVIPAYGDSPYITICIESLLAQQHECNISITTSTPSAYIEDVASRYGIELVINDTSKSGIAPDWNFAYRLANADLVVIAHQDDIYLPQFSREAIAFFRRKPAIGLAFTDCYELISERKSAWHKRELVKKIIRELAFFGRKSILDQFSYRQLLAYGCPIPCPAVIFNKAKLENFEFSDDFQVNLDWDAWSRLAKLGVGFGYIRNRSMIHRIHQHAETQVAIKDNRRGQEDYKMFGRFWPPCIVKLLMSLYRYGY